MYNNYEDFVDRVGSDESNIVIVENFLNKENFDKLLKIKDSIPIDQYDSDIFYNFNNLKEEDQNFVLNITKDIIKLINTKFLISVSIKSYPMFARHPKDGYFLPEHKDDKEDRSPLHQIASILYLNDDYSGGEIYFSQYSKIIKPKANSLVFFPGNKNYMHGVNECLYNDRFSLSTFYSIEF